MEQSGALLSSTLRHGLKCTLITEVWCGQLLPLSFSWNKNTYRWPTIQSGALGVELERVLLCFIDSDPVYTFHNKYKNIFLIHSNEIFLFDGIYGGIFRNQNFSSYRQNDGFTTKRKNINFP